MTYFFIYEPRVFHSIKNEKSIKTREGADGNRTNMENTLPANWQDAPAFCDPRPVRSAGPFAPDEQAAKHPVVMASSGDLASALCEAALRGHDHAMALVASWVEAGIDLEHLYLDVVTPAARALGEGWLSDRIDFASVTLASYTLQQIVYEWSDKFLDSGSPASRDLSLLVLSASGNSHGLGPSLLGQFFRRAGWRVQSECCESDTQLARIVQSEWYDLVGFSVSMDQWAAHLPACIARLRRLSANPGVLVMVGGPWVDAHPLQASALGADWVGGDAHEAERQARRRLSRSMQTDEPVAGSAHGTVAGT
ncbi:MAG: cobalamin B12-binding domain-containing protein [Rhodoferax sp.]|nr:cobalamin B12-binding domain-containing protein [Rhodoferax sp.]